MDYNKAAIKSKKVLDLKKGKLYISDKTNQNKIDKPKEIFSLGLAGEIGFTVSVPLVLGAFLGVWLDEKIGTRPKITLSLIFLGLFVSIINLYKIIKDIIKEGKR